MSLDQSCTESPDRQLQQVAVVESTIIAEYIPADADLKTNPLAVGMSPAHAARLRFFQPSARPQMLTGEWQENCFGRLRVEGRLGQRHADLHDAIVVSATECCIDRFGQLHLLVDLAEIRRTMSDHRYSYEQLDVCRTKSCTR